MSELFRRYYELQINRLLITSDDLDVEFKIENNIEKTAGQAEIAIYNLSDDSKSKIEKSKVIQLKAGYKGDYGIVFYGKIDRVWDEQEEGDVKTVIQASDMTKMLFESGYTVKMYPKGTKIEDIIKEMFEMAGVPVGKIDSPGITLNTDRVFRGSPHQIIEKCVALTNGELARSSGLFEGFLRQQYRLWTAYVKNNMGYFVRKDYQESEAIVLSSETGLMEVSKSEDENETIDYLIRALFNWKISQNSLIQLLSMKTSGVFKVVEFKHVCKGDDYYTECGVKAI